MNTFVCFIFVMLLSLLVCRAEDLEQSKPTWQVGDFWTVLTNVRRQLSQPEITKRKNEHAAELHRKLNELDKYWEQNIKPQGVSQIEWERSDDYRTRAKELGFVKDNPDKDSLYEAWMTSTEDWTTISNKELWCRWKFEVEASEKLHGSDCFRIKFSFDAFKDISEDEVKSAAWLKCPSSYFRIWLRSIDGTLARFEERNVEGDAIQREKQYDVAAPRYADSSISENFKPFFVSLPFTFPQFSIAAFNPSRSEDKTTEAQRKAKIGDRTVFTFASETEIDQIKDFFDKTKTYPRFERQFWRKGFPWWEEAYRFQYGGIRARLECVNGKHLPAPGESMIISDSHLFDQ